MHNHTLKLLGMAVSVKITVVGKPFATAIEYLYLKRRQICNELR